MQRREFITFIGSTVAWPLAVRAQPSAMPVIGSLSTASPDQYLDNAAAFERGLAERGYVVGRNVTIERRWARGNYDRLPELAQELVRLNPALILVGGNVVALAVKRAISTIPIVFIIGSDPVKLGLAKSFAHPGGNATGISMMTATLTLKRLELIRELLPQNATRKIKTCYWKSKTLPVRLDSPWRSRRRAVQMTSNQHSCSLSVLESARYSSAMMRCF
jgi:putative tryptophan/tyrosine transport system substrate-binding protein